MKSKMSMLKLFAGIMLGFVLFMPCHVNGQVRIIKGAKAFAGNPTLYYDGITGNAQISSDVGSLLNACGWFDVLVGGKTDYTLSGTYSGNSLNLVLKQDGNNVCSVTTSSSDTRRAAKLAIDAILKKSFKIDGICSTKIVFSAETSPGMKNIWMCDIDGKELQRITSFSTLCVEPGWFPDGKSIVYTIYSKSETDIVQTQLNPLKSRRIASYPGLNAGAAISPNGQNLAMITSKDRQIELYIKSVNGDARSRLTSSKAVKASPCWSPTGGSLIYVCDQTGSPQLYRISATGGTPVRLSTVGSEAATPDWSKDNQIAYSAKVDGQYTIAVLDLEGKKPSGAVLGGAPGHWESPSWAPDNRYVVSSRRSGSKSSLCVVDTWTGKFRPLISVNESTSMPCWSKIF